MVLAGNNDNVNTLILELTKLEVKLLCQLVHLYLCDDKEKKPLGRKLVESLKQQTDCFIDDPSLMGVYTNAIKATDNSFKIKETYLDIYDKFYENINW